MNKTTMMGLVLAGALGAFAGVDNVAITFSTPGPDTYKDGRQVLDGECYALVWTPTGAAFGGIAADVRRFRRARSSSRRRSRRADGVRTSSSRLTRAM